MGTSNCCGAEVLGKYSGCGRCAECLEHCGTVEEDDE